MPEARRTGARSRTAAGAATGAPGIAAGGSTSAAAAQADVAPAAVVVVGEEEFLVERAVSAVVADTASRWSAAGAGDSPDVHDVLAGDLSPGELSALAAPTLFGGGIVVIVRSAQDATKEVAAELTRHAEAPAGDVLLVITHSGGGRNKSLLASLSGERVRRIDCPPVKRFGERLDFLRGEFSRAGRKADEAGLTALLDAVGTDLRELAAACSQLAADTTGVISQQVVSRYYRGRAEATGFTVADRAIEGKLAESLEQLRWALSTGVSPVLISSALAQGVRALGRVGAASRTQRADSLAAELGMPAWKIEQVRRQLRGGWTSQGVARAHAAAAQADAQVKGEGASPGYALERAITEIVASRSAG